MVVAKCLSHSLKSERLLLHAQFQTAQPIPKYSGWITVHAVLHVTGLLLHYCSSLALREEGSDERTRSAENQRRIGLLALSPSLFTKYPLRWLQAETEMFPIWRLK